jgi:hypothetical protein
MQKNGCRATQPLGPCGVNRVLVVSVHIYVQNVQFVEQCHDSLRSVVVPFVIRPSEHCKPFASSWVSSS